MISWISESGSASERAYTYTLYSIKYLFCLFKGKNFLFCICLPCFDQVFHVCLKGMCLWVGSSMCECVCVSG